MYRGRGNASEGNSKGRWRGNRGNLRGRGGWCKSRRGNPATGSVSMLPPPTPGTSTLSTQLTEEDGSFVIPPMASQRLITTMLPRIPTPYKGWHLYMSEDYHDNSEAVTFIRSFEVYLRSLKVTVLDSARKRFNFAVDLQHMAEDVGVNAVVPDLLNAIISDPQRIINCLGVAMYQIVVGIGIENLSSSAVSNKVESINFPKIHVRLVNHSVITSLMNLKANLYGKLVSVRGTVVRVSSIKPLCTQLTFICTGCQTPQGIGQPAGRYTVPTGGCVGHGCRGRNFQVERSHSLTRTVDWQSVRLQETVGDNQEESGRVPRSVECELTDDLVDSCVPGDMVTVTGIVKVTQSEEGRGNRNDRSLFLLYLDVSSVVNSKVSNDPASAAGIEFSLRDFYCIQKIQAEPELFSFMVTSLCPAIYGHEMVKAGLLLCLFGGSRKGGDDRVPVRGDAHILIVGDPGLGKSQMLQACANVAPRGVYVCGNTTTTSGLTVTLCRESGGDYALEGGALVLADQGVCCIDEFDKMSSQHQALLEAMEQQTISIAKAGIVCTLPSRAAILAAANPVGGHYNKAKTVSENLKMNSALLSRFDLVFILLDKPDEEMDCLLSEHVMAMHSAGRRGMVGVRVRRQDLDSSSVDSNPDQTLSQRLKLNSSNELLPSLLLRKYICYARKYVHPHLTSGAAKVLQAFYLDLRQRHQNPDSTPITTRQLESLIRLTEARARSELREEATKADAQDVVEIMRSSMIDTYSDEFGLLDFQRSQNGSGSSNRSQMRKFVSALQRVSENTYKSTFSLDEMRQLSRQTNIHVRDFGEFIASLNHHGFLLKKGPRIYQLLIADG